MINPSNFQLQQAVKALLESRQPKIKQVQDSNTKGRVIEVKIKSQSVNIPIETNRQYRNMTGSFR